MCEIIHASTTQPTQAKASMQARRAAYSAAACDLGRACSRHNNNLDVFNVAVFSHIPASFYNKVHVCMMLSCIVSFHQFVGQKMDRVFLLVRIALPCMLHNVSHRQCTI